MISFISDNTEEVIAGLSPSLLQYGDDAVTYVLPDRIKYVYEYVVPSYLSSEPVKYA